MKQRALADVTVVVSVKADSSVRLENLDRLRSFYAALAEGLDILLVVQPPTPSLESMDGLRVHRLADDGLHWKTRNMNVGASLSSRPWLLMSDADVVPHPDALAEGVAMLSDGVGFVSLYNGIVVNIPAAASANLSDWTTFLASLPHYEARDVVPGKAAKHPVIRPLYGNAEHSAVGGCFLCSRAAFFGIGGWNPNIISYGFEDQELHYRATRLGHEFPSVQGHNLYHFDHPRGPESRYGQFYRQNRAEFDRVRNMAPDVLATYAARGFRQMAFRDGFDYARFSTAEADGWHRVKDARTDLSDLTILVLADPQVVTREASCLEPLLDHLEESYQGYDLRICEDQTTAFKYPLNRRNVVFCSTSHGPTREEMDGIVTEANRSCLYVLRLEKDAERQLRLAAARLAKVRRGLSVQDVFPATEQALADAL